MSDIKNLIIAVVLTVLVLVGWQYFYEMPRLNQQRAAQGPVTSQIPKEKVEPHTFINRDAALNQVSLRVKISGNKLQGSISLLGARIDDITLPQYRESLEPNSQHVVLLSPARTDNAYFVELGWAPTDESIEWPTSKTLWSANKLTLGSNDQVTLSWTNKQNILFQIDIALDSDYMFTVKQTVKNNSCRAIVLQEYGLINRIHDQKGGMSISHEGPIGVFNKILKEETYSDLESAGDITYSNNNPGSWLGISDKYWLVALLPNQSQKFDAKFQHTRYMGKKKFQADYINPREILEANALQTKINHIFVGAKVVSTLDNYGQNFNLDLFDRAVDFGWFYFITKPMFHALKYFYNVVGNFGISILIVTIIVKLLLFPLANRSFISMNRMKKLQPELVRIKELHADDKIKQNQAIMDLYKKEKVSPLSGCLPLLIQIPIFFSLYKVLFITIEMRHAPFYGWIKDLSAPDPTTVFNLFGLLPWSPPSFLLIGAWPIIMAITMYVQQKMSPEPADPTQAQVMKFLPLVFVFMFASFPAGLVIYWAWSNVLSIIQQYFIQYKARGI